MPPALVPNAIAPVEELEAGMLMDGAEHAGSRPWPSEIGGRAPGGLAVGDGGVLESVITRMGCGFCRLDEAGRLVWLSARAADILARCGPQCSGEVARFATQAAKAGDGADGHVLWLVVDSRSAPPRLLQKSSEPGPSWMRFAVIMDVAQPLLHGLDVLRGTFALTRAEAATAAAIAQGASPAEIAAARGVSEPTVRTQLSAALEKTGTRRQSELAVLFTRLNLLP